MKASIHAGCEGFAGPTTYFSESYDAPIFESSDIEAETAALYAKKYKNEPIDLVVGVGGFTAELIDKYRSQIWPNAAIMFTGVHPRSITPNSPLHRYPYTAWSGDTKGTLDLVQALQPAAKRLIIVSGTTNYDTYQTQLSLAVAKERKRWDIEVWDTYSQAQLRDKLALLDKDTAVLYISIFKDAAGQASYPRDALENIALTSKAPVYGMYGTYIGRGIVAGSVIDYQIVGKHSAKVAFDLLQGKSAPLSKLQGSFPATCFADAKRIDSFGLSTRNLPPDCTIQNPLRNLWTDYKGIVMTAAAVILLQGLTIGAMLWQRRRRRSAEQESNVNRLELRRAMRFASMGELTASIAHEINQPLGAILSNAEAAEILLNKGRADPEELKAILADIRRDDQRAHAVVSRIRSLLTKAESPKSPVHLHASIQEVMALLLPEAKRRNVSLALSLEAHNDLVNGDSVQFQQVLLNLVMNAMDALDAQLPPTRRIHIKTRSADDHITVSVADNGCGMDEATQATIFDSLFTTKKAGLGMGLSIVRAIVDAHSGTIEVQSSPGDGAVFSVRLPVIKENL